MIPASEGRSREHTLALALVVPSVLVLLAVAAVEVWRVVAPAEAQAGHRTYTSLGEAIAEDDLLGAYDLIRRGENPNELTAVFDPVLTGGQELLVPPIVWAAAAGRGAIVFMLIGAGVTFDRDADRAAACIADQMKFGDIAEALRQFGRLPPASACPAPQPGPPLLAVAAPADRRP